MKFFKEELTPSVLAQGSSFSGTLHVTGNIRLDGTIVGDVKCLGKISIGRTGTVDSKKIEVEELEVAGTIRGNTFTEKITLFDGAKFNGTINTKKMIVRSGAKLNANVKCIQ